MDSETSETLAAAPISAGPFDPAGFPEFFVANALRDPLSLLNLHSDGAWGLERDIPGASKIRTAINTSSSINALAFQNGAFRLVSLNVGMCIRVRQMMWQATHNTEVFKPRPDEQMLRPELLTESNSKFSPKWLIEPIAVQPGLDDDFYYKMLTPVAPSIERVNLAVALTRCALNFIVLHEIGHLVRNQTPFLPGGQPALFMEMRHDLPAPSNKKEIIVRRLLEVDADLAAVEVGFQTSDQGAAQWSEWTENPIEAAGLWIISVALVFWLFQACDTSVGSQSHLHPSPLTRIMYLASYLADIIPGLDLLNADDVIPFTMGAIASAAEVWDGFGLSKQPSFSRDEAIIAMSEVEEITKGLKRFGIRTGGD